MKKLFEPVVRLAILTVVIGFLAFPALSIIQWLAPDHITPLDTYIEILSNVWVYVYAWGDWAVVIILSLVFLSQSNTFIETAKTMRLKRVMMEYDRWAKTPYVSPVFYYSLVSTPINYSSSLREATFGRFYQTIVDKFRNRVYFNASFSEQEPSPKLSWVKVAGFSMLASSVVGIGAIIGFFVLLYQVKNPSLWFTGWEKFGIPVLLFISSWVTQQLYAIITIGSGKDLETKVMEYFNGVEPQITWRDVYPDRPYGEVVIKACTAIRDQMQQNYYYFMNKPIPSDSKMKYDNPALPCYPYPEGHIPEWANQMESQVHNKLGNWRDEKIEKSREAVHSSKGKVVELKKKRKV
jgi:hypothetical protein